MATLSSLPPELQQEIISHLDFLAITLLRATSTYFRQLPSLALLKRSLYEFETSHETKMLYLVRNNDVLLKPRLACYQCIQVKPYDYFSFVYYHPPHAARERKRMAKRRMCLRCSRKDWKFAGEEDD